MPKCKGLLRPVGWRRCGGNEVAIDALLAYSAFLLGRLLLKRIIGWLSKYGIHPNRNFWHAIAAASHGTCDLIGTSLSRAFNAIASCLRLSRRCRPSIRLMKTKSKPDASAATYYQATRNFHHTASIVKPLYFFVRSVAQHAIHRASAMLESRNRRQPSSFEEAEAEVQSRVPKINRKAALRAVGLCQLGKSTVSFAGRMGFEHSSRGPT